MIPRRFITMRNCRRTRKRNNFPFEAVYEKNRYRTVFTLYGIGFFMICANHNRWIALCQSASGVLWRKVRELRDPHPLFEIPDVPQETVVW